MMAYGSRLGLGFALLCASTVALPAQAPDACTYDACALRIQHGFSGGALVQGFEGRRVARLGYWAPAVPVFAQRSDTAARYYTTFLRRQRSGAVMTLVGLAASAGALFIADSDDALGAGIAIGGGVLMIGGTIQLGRAAEPLSQAIWWYNRTLPTTE